MGTDIRKLSPEERARLAAVRFEEYLKVTRWLIFALAFLILLLWFWDRTFDPVGARDTIELRAVLAIAALLSSVIINKKTGITASAIVLYTTMLFIQAVYTQILAILSQGFLIGIGSYLYFFVSILLLGTPFSFRANTIGTLLITFAPHLWGFVIDPSFPHLLYITLIWPAGVICIFFHWSTGNMILDRLRYRSKIEDLAMEDPLTGLLNRRALLNEYIKARSLAAREHEELSLIILDIDHFKDINDSYGHTDGDHVLEELAVLLQKTCRASDTLARIGGEEFVCLMPDTGLDEAVAIGERLRATVEKARIKSVTRRDTNISITISLGVTRAIPTENLDHIMARADQALYKAKTGGRNRLVHDP